MNRHAFCATVGLCAWWIATSLAGCSSTVDGTVAQDAGADRVAEDVAAPEDISRDVPVDTTRPDVPPPDAGPVTCASNADCPRGTVCEYAMGCGQTRGTCDSDTCQELPVAPQYCGCDGRTLQQVSACLPDRRYASMGACPDAGAPVDVAVSDAATSRYADAVMIWQSPGGFAGWGPALMVTGDGAVRFWRMRSGFTLDTASSVAADRTEHVTPADVDALFSAWATTDLSHLPHAGTGGECYPSVTVRTCASCRPDSVMYTTPASVQPEMNAVWAWFEARYGADSPQNYCRF